MGSDVLRDWVEQWEAAGEALEKVRARELRALSNEEALAISDNLLRLAAQLPISEERWRSSGLVRMQVLFQRLSA